MKIKVIGYISLKFISVKHYKKLARLTVSLVYKMDLKKLEAINKLYAKICPLTGFELFYPFIPPHVCRVA